MLRCLITRTVTITFTRALGVSMSVVDIMVLSRFSPSHIPSFAIAAQWVQVLVVACGSLGVGICVCIPKASKDDRPELLFSVMGLAVAAGILASACAFAMSYLPMADPHTGTLIRCLALGMVPLSLYACLASFNQSNECSKQVLIITLGAVFINAALDVALIHIMSNAAMAVAQATAITWWLMGCASVAYTIVRLRRKPKIWVGDMVMRILEVSLPDLFSKLAFVASITLYYSWFSFNMTSEALSDVMRASNYMNIVFIVFASAATAFSITFCENGKEQKLTQYGRYTTVCCLCLLIILLAVSPVFSHVYFGQVSTYAWGLLLIGTLTVAIDGVSLFAITYLRINGLSSLPPYFRLILFPAMGAYYVVIDTLDAISVFTGMMIGNLVALGALGFAYKKMFCWGNGSSRPIS